MRENWTPTGYTDPRAYEINNRLIVAIALVLTLPVFQLARPSLVEGASAFVPVIIALGEFIGPVKYPHMYMLATLLLIAAWTLLTVTVIVAVHEGIHYVLGAIRGLNPRFKWSSHLGLKNPSIVAYSERITRGESLLMLVGPFAILTPICAAVMWFTSGVLAATAATMLCINAIASCADLYNVGRIALMPRGTLFANFDDEDGLRSEFATPSDTVSP